MSRRAFTVAEVNALVPVLERGFLHVLQLRAGLRGVEEKLERAGVGTSDDDLVIQESDGQESRLAKAFYRGYDEALSDALAAIQTLGCEIKDVDRGLVDFPSRRNGEDILLCWQLGERACSFWHDARAGFAGRRPIDAHILQISERLD
jgi:hypothetical protein